MSRAKREKALVISRKAFGRRLFLLREACCGLKASGAVKYEPLVSILRVSSSTWTKWEYGTAISPEILLALIVDLRVSALWLKGGDDTMFVDGTPPREFQ